MPRPTCRPLLAILLTLGSCGLDEDRSAPEQSTIPLERLIFLEVTGEGASNFSGYLEADIEEVLRGGLESPYVTCQTHDRDASVSISDPNSGMPNIPLLVVSGIENKEAKVTGHYVTSEQTGQGRRDNELTHMKVYLDTKGILEIADPSSIDFFNGTQECTADVAAKTGSFTCRFRQSGSVIETVTGRWACYGLFN